MRPRGGRGTIRALRAAPHLRQRHQSTGGRPTRALRGLRPLRARHPVPALGAHGGHLRAREPETRLLPVDGVPHRPLAGQQRDEPLARSLVSRPSRRKASIGSACWRRNPMRAWATGDSAAWRPASSIRWPRCSSRPWATGCGTNTACSGSPSRMAGSRTAGQLAPPPGPLGGPRPHERVEVKLNCSFEVRGGSLHASPAGRPR